MVTLYFFVSVLNNYSLVFDIPMPLHMIFRAVRVCQIPTQYSLWSSNPQTTLGVSDGQHDTGDTATEKAVSCSYKVELLNNNFRTHWDRGLYAFTQKL